MIEEIMKRMDLQLFAGNEPEPENVEDDDPGKTDTEEENMDISSLYESEEEEENEGEEEEEEGPEATGEEGEDTGSEEKPEEKPEEKMFTQEEVNRIIGNARIKGREMEQVVQELQTLTGMDPNSLVEYIKKNQVQEKADEMGLTEEEARQLVEKDARLARMEQEMHGYKAQQQQLAYNNEKTRFLSDPLVKKYEQEIDAFAHDQQGNVVANFEVAMNYILGQKLASGELKKVLQEGTEQKTLANIKKRGKARPETSTVSGATDNKGLTKEERALAKSLDIDPKDWQKNKK